MPARKKATAADAELILKLYELRRDPELRKARNWSLNDLWPESVDDLLGIARAFGSEPNRYFRMVFSYWDMACALVVHGALSADLFFDCSGEMYPLFAKVQPFIPGFRQAVDAPDAFVNMEKLILGSKQTRDRLARVEKALVRWKQLRAQAAKSQR